MTLYPLSSPSPSPPSVSAHVCTLLTGRLLCSCASVTGSRHESIRRSSDDHLERHIREMVRFLDLPFSFPPSSVARMATFFRPARCLSRAGASRGAPTSPVQFDSDGQCFISSCSATATTWASSSDDLFLGASGLLSLALYARDGRHSQLISANSGIGRPRERA